MTLSLGCLHFPPGHIIPCRWPTVSLDPPRYPFWRGLHVTGVQDGGRGALQAGHAVGVQDSELRRDAGYHGLGGWVGKGHCPSEHYFMGPCYWTGGLLGRRRFGKADVGRPRAEECGLAPPLSPGGTEADGSWGLRTEGAQPAWPKAPMGACAPPRDLWGHSLLKFPAPQPLPAVCSWGLALRNPTPVGGRGPKAARGLPPPGPPAICDLLCLSPVKGVTWSPGLGRAQDSVSRDHTSSSFLPREPHRHPAAPDPSPCAGMWG